MSYRAGFVGLIGLPNAGKSTLLNLFVDEKVSIVSAKPQTTRRRVLGIKSMTEGQIVFVDSPGVIEAEKGLNAFLSSEAKDVVQQSDVLMAVLNIDAKSENEIIKIVDLIKASSKPVVIVFSKTDLVQYQRRIEIMKRKLSELRNIKFTFEVSQAWGKELKPILADIEKALVGLLPETPEPLYDIELFTPHTQRELVEEIIREKCFSELDMEIPYNLAVQVLTFREEDLVKITCVILVSKETHKAIVIGKKAETIKKIGMLARKEIEKMIGKKVFLQLDVKFKENWMQNSRTMKELGYVVESKS